MNKKSLLSVVICTISMTMLLCSGILGAPSHQTSKATPPDIIQAAKVKDCGSYLPDGTHPAITTFVQAYADYKDYGKRDLLPGFFTGIDKVYRLEVVDSGGNLFFNTACSVAESFTTFSYNPVFEQSLINGGIKMPAAGTWPMSNPLAFPDKYFYDENEAMINFSSPADPVTSTGVSPIVYSQPADKWYSLTQNWTISSGKKAKSLGSHQLETDEGSVIRTQ